MSTLEIRQKLSEFLATTQQNRLMRLSFPRGDDPGPLLVIDRLEAVEELSRDFCFELQLLSDDPHIPLKDMLGKLLAVELIRSDNTPRYFTGHVLSFSYIGTDAGLARYEAVLGPWLGLLRNRSNNRIFHSLTRLEQTRQIFGEYGSLRDWDTRLRDDDPVMTDAIQFMEADYNYLHRRWEENGWYYWYEHSAEGHRLMLGDDSCSAEPVDGEPAVRYQIESGSLDQDVVSRLEAVRDVASARYAVSSFDFKHPRPTSAFIPTLNEQGEAVPSLEVYEYTGAYGYPDSAGGDKLARRRMEEIESAAKRFEGRGNNPYLQPGRWFSLDTDYRTQAIERIAGEELLVTAIRHSATNNYAQNGVGAAYENHFECQRKSVVWRPGRGHNSETCRIDAPQTAIVVGPAGREIHTDEYGRVRVQFHWDREGTYDEKSSAWVRVASNWAGSNYGFMALPRIGQEVIVQFLDGNPDRPIITGRVYNAQQMPPWKLDSQQALTGFRSKELYGGGFNHLILDDTTEKIQTQLSSTHHLSQLSLGHITRIPGTEGRKDFRGEGFELRTDAWGAVRAGQGLFLSADQRSNAQSTQLDMKEAKKQLEEAESFLQGMSEAAEKAGAMAAACKRQSDLLRNRLDGLREAGIVASAPSGIAWTTPSDLQHASGENTYLTAGRNYNSAVMHHYTLFAREGISQFVQTNGMKQIAGKGKIEVMALDDDIHISGDKDVKIISSDGEVTITAEKELTVACGGAYITLKGGNIEFGCTGGLDYKCASYTQTGPATLKTETVLPSAGEFDPIKRNPVKLSK